MFQKKLVIYVFCLLGKNETLYWRGIPVYKSHFSYFDNELHCFYQYFKIVLLFFAFQLKEWEDGQVETVHWKDKKALNVSMLHVAVAA